MNKQTEKINKVRLDRLLVERGLVESRERGHALLLAGQVLVNDQKVGKAGTLIPADAEVRILGGQMPYVSRGGLKLEAALRDFGIEAVGLTALDVGASTGGFTDCLLQHGAKQVYAVDVGYGQMAWKLRQDRRVTVVERVNIREIDPALVPEPVDVAVIDVSFISLEKVLPPVIGFLKPGGGIVALIKPQFEVGKGLVGKGGIVRDDAARQQAVEKIRSFAQEQGFDVRGVIQSPITGQDGNIEYLMYAVLTSDEQEGGKTMNACPPDPVQMARAVLDHLSRQRGEEDAWEGIVQGVLHERPDEHQTTRLKEAVGDLVTQGLLERTGRSGSMFYRIVKR